MQKLTSFPKRAPGSSEWFLVDAENKILGKVASEVANRLRGKRKSTFTDHLNGGDHVIVINAEKIALTGNKRMDKFYRRHSGYVGHLREESAEKVLEKQPKRILKEAIYGMLPKNKLRKHFMKNLIIESGAEHPHAGQNPQTINIT